MSTGELEAGKGLPVAAQKLDVVLSSPWRITPMSSAIRADAGGRRDVPWRRDQAADRDPGHAARPAVGLGADATRTT